jgi:hypothetical protein
MDSMALESTFLQVNRGSRLSAYMGLQMVAGTPYKFDQNYLYVEIPVLELWNPAEEKPVSKALRNQYIRVIPSCTLNVRGGYIVQVEPNPALWEYGPTQGMYYVPTGSGEVVPSFHMQLRKDMNVEDVDFAVRLYLRA